MADNQEELKELFETGVTQRQMDAAKQKYAAIMPSENKAKGIQLKLGPASKDKPTNLNPEAKKKGGVIKSASKRADGCCIRGKTRA